MTTVYHVSSTLCLASLIVTEALGSPNLQPCSSLAVRVPFLHLYRIPLRPIPHRLALDLTARQLGHFVDEHDAADEALVLGHARCEPVLDVLRGDFAFGGILEDNIGAGPLIAITARGVSERVPV